MSDFKIKPVNNNSAVYSFPVNNETRGSVARELSKDTLEISTKKENKNNNSKIAAIAGSIVGLAIIAAFIIKKNSSCVVKKIAQEINFEPAKSLDEAIKFGKENLGIKTYSGFEKGDIDAINWINGGLTNVANKYCGSKVKMPRIIEYSTRVGDNALAAVDIKKGVMSVNKNIFSNFDAVLDKISNDPSLKTDNGFKKLLRHYQESTKDFNDKLSFYQSCTELINSYTMLAKRPSLYIEALKGAMEKAGVQFEYGDAQSLDGIKKLPVQEQLSILFENMRRLTNQTGKKILFKSHKISIYDTIYHEMGHLQDKFREATYHFNGDKAEYSKELLKWVNDKDALAAAMRVSAYSMTGPGEFIAETYKSAINGNEITSDVMNLYKKLGGPSIPKLI